MAGDQIPLPAFHGMFVRYGDGRLLPKGGSTLLIPAEGTSTEVQNIPGLSLPRLGLSRVYTGLQLPQTINTADIFIHKEGLPIAFKLIGAELTANGVNLRYGDIEYLHSGFSSVDIRDKNQKKNERTSPTLRWNYPIQKSGLIHSCTSTTQGSRTPTNAQTFMSQYFLGTSTKK